MARTPRPPHILISDVLQTIVDKTRDGSLPLQKLPEALRGVIGVLTTPPATDEEKAIFFKKNGMLDS